MPRCAVQGIARGDALIGNYLAEQLFELTQAVRLYDFYQTQVAQCDERIELALRHLQTGV